SHALLSKANHIHIEPRAGALHIRYRIKGTLHEAMILPKHIHPHLVLRTKHLAGLDLKDLSPQEGRISYESGKDKVNLRVSTMPGTHGEKMVLRRVPAHASGFTLESLGLIGKNLDCVHEILEEREGLLLISAPKASGKTTFMYTAIDLIHKERHNIQTVEEKVEYLLPGTTQSEVNVEKGLTYQRLVRAALRQDPDVLMVSAVEDEGTASLLSSAALRGELVMAGIEADTPVEAIIKFGEIAGVGLSASALVGAVGIRLVNRIGKTAEKYNLNREETNSLGKLISLPKMLSILKDEGIVEQDATWEDVPFFREIRITGNEDPGKIGLFEVIRANSRIRELVMKNGSRTSIEGERELGGGLSFLEDGVMKAALGHITLEEVLVTLS
ncbi:MAG: ATPase, T2SS/T4P/T4SS family, partial [Parcubacteria group bacterium]